MSQNSVIWYFVIIGLIRKWHGIISMLSSVPFLNTLGEDVHCHVLKLVIQWFIGYQCGNERNGHVVGLLCRRVT